MNRRRWYRIVLVVGWIVVAAGTAWAVPHRLAELQEAHQGR
ncbi:hypothetical protein [Bradyrhizobium yuanmingense]|nr:hypothetical protein [Bradyrhizobium yuanmingense]